MHPQVKSLTERNPVVVGLVGCVLTAAAVLAALFYDKLPFISPDRTYQAYFSEAGGLTAGAEVHVAGYRVGQVSSVRLNSPNVVVTFAINHNIYLGDRTEASIKTKTLLGAKILQLLPRGDAALQGPIPLDHTTSAYELPRALGDITTTISGLDVNQLSASLSVVADTFRGTAPELRSAADGIARFSAGLNARDAALRNMLVNANTVSTVLSNRSEQITQLVSDTNTLLAELRTESEALDHLAGNVSELARQTSGLVAEQRNVLGPSLDKLNQVLTIIDNRKQQIQQAIPMLSRYAMSLGETVGSGPFFKAYLANLLPGQFVQPFVEAAFADLGLDPAVQAPSELSDPPTGQPATPALPQPYPRTGQGGPPRLTLPDAITGNPGDQGCGPPGIPLPGPTGCYPYREPPAAPPPGGPPPGPPALGPASTPNQTPEGGAP